MKYLLLLLILFSNSLFSQNFNPKNPGALVGELGKNGLIVNLLYDQYFSQKHFGFRAGGGSTLINHNFELRTATVGFYFLIGKKKEFYDLGLELQYHFADLYADDVKTFTFVDPAVRYEGVYPFFNIGYRRYSEKGVFRIGLAFAKIEREFITGAYIGYGIILNRRGTK